MNKDAGARLLPAGTVAPDFTLHVTPDQELSLSDLRYRPVILALGVQHQVMSKPYASGEEPRVGDEVHL